MQQIAINNYDDLLTFIKRKDINAEQAAKVIKATLNVIILYVESKETLIKQTEYHINKFCKNNTGERPLFLCQKELEFDIKDIYNPDEVYN